MTDPNANRASILAMQALGAQVVVITDRDAAGGYLQSRLDYIARRLAADQFLHWPNQYANEASVVAHRDRTAAGIHRAVGEIDVLAVGAGTTGTLMGCLRYFTKHCPGTRIVAVDAVGSVFFGGPPAPRAIPGLGVSRVPELFCDDPNLEKAIVAEDDTVAMCRHLAREYGLLAGGSTGTVLAGVAASPRSSRPAAGQWPSPPTSAIATSRRSTTMRGPGADIQILSCPEPTAFNCR